MGLAIFSGGLRTHKLNNSTLKLSTNAYQFSKMLRSPVFDNHALIPENPKRVLENSAILGKSGASAVQHLRAAENFLLGIKVVRPYLREFYARICSNIMHIILDECTPILDKKIARSFVKCTRIVENYSSKILL